MVHKLDPATEGAVRAEARRLEAGAATEEPYPAETIISRPNQTSRMFNVRLTDEQFAAIQDLAGRRHLPMSTMARAWLLDRLENERHAS